MKLRLRPCQVHSVIRNKNYYACFRNAFLSTTVFWAAITGRRRTSCTCHWRTTALLARTASSASPCCSSETWPTKLAWTPRILSSAASTWTIRASPSRGSSRNGPTTRWPKNSYGWNQKPARPKKRHEECSVEKKFTRWKAKNYYNNNNTEIKK